MNGFNYSQPKTQFSSYFNPATGVGTSTNNIIWVQGIEGAKAWQLAPNSMAILLDSEAEGKMYIKVSDNIGMSSLRIFNYTEELLPNKNNSYQNNNLDLSQYVTKQELVNMVKEIAAAATLQDFIIDVDNELAEAQLMHLEDKEVEFDITVIITKQDKMYKDYKKKCHNLFK